LPFFTALFYTWLAILIFLLFSGNGAKNDNWERLALLCIFALVFLGFWVIMLPYGQGVDAICNLAHVKYLENEGRINLTNQNLRYFNFPGLFLATSALSQITGLNLFTTGNLMVLMTVIMIAVLLYILFVILLKSVRYALLTVMLTILGSRGLNSASFHPGYFQFIFICLFLILLSRQESILFERQRDKLILTLLLTAATITYFIASTSFFFIVTGIYLVCKLRKQNSTGIPIFLLLVIIPLSWELYYAVQIFNELIVFIRGVTEDVIAGEKLTAFLLQMEQAIGGETPAWASIIQSFWLIFIYGFGGFLAIKHLIQKKELNLLETRELGGLLGVFLLALLSGIISPYGFRFITFIIYAPIFLAPLIVRSLLNPSNRWRKYTLAVLLTICFVLAWPTTLVYHSTISSNALYAQDIVAGEFLESLCNKSNIKYIFSNQRQGIDVGRYYAWNVIFMGPPEPYELTHEEALWNSIKSLVEKFKQSDGGIFANSERAKYRWMFELGIRPTDSRWQKIENNLLERNKVYENGLIQLYSP
jgi:hypothetical protein